MKTQSFSSWHGPAEDGCEETRRRENPLVGSWTHIKQKERMKERIKENTDNQEYESVNSISKF